MTRLNYEQNLNKNNVYFFRIDVLSLRIEVNFICHLFPFDFIGTFNCFNLELLP